MAKELLSGSKIVLKLKDEAKWKPFEIATAIAKHPEVCYWEKVKEDEKIPYILKEEIDERKPVDSYSAWDVPDRTICYDGKNKYVVFDSGNSIGWKCEDDDDICDFCEPVGSDYLTVLQKICKVLVEEEILKTKEEIKEFFNDDRKCYYEILPFETINSERKYYLWPNLPGMWMFEDVYNKDPSNIKGWFWDKWEENDNKFEKEIDAIIERKELTKKDDGDEIGEI